MEDYVKHSKIDIASAIRLNNIKTFKKLVKKKTQYPKNNKQFVEEAHKHYYLYLACIYNRDEMVKILLDKGVNVDQIRNNHTPILGIVDDRTFNGILRVLLNHGANVNFCDTKYKQTPLYRACCYDNFEGAKLLIENGANVNQKRQSGFSPLSTAACNGYKNIVLLLIENNANINIVNNGGNTPLYGACSMYNKRDKEMVTLLVKHGADLENLRGKCYLCGKIPLLEKFKKEIELGLQQRSLILIGLGYIRKNINIFKDKIHRLPFDLRRHIKINK